MSNRRVLFFLPALLVWAWSIAPSAGSASRDDRMCGPRSLYVVCNELGVKATLEEITALTRPTKEGTSLKSLYRAAGKKGLRGLALKISCDALLKMESPAIAYLWGGHYVVVKHAAANAVTVIDVNDGPGNNAVHSIDEFRAAYSGFALILSRNEIQLPTSDSSDPDLRIQGDFADFGSVDEGQKILHRFALRNAGKSELVISSIRSSCGCMIVNSSTTYHIPANGHAEVTVELDTLQKPGPTQEYAYICSNDPVAPISVLTLRGLVRPMRLEVSSREVDFGLVHFMTPSRRKIRIGNPADDSLAVKAATTSGPSICTEITDVGKDLPGYKDILITLRPGLPLGEFHGMISIESPMSQQNGT